jgi:hypothetical protein
LRDRGGYADCKCKSCGGEDEFHDSSPLDAVRLGVLG